VGRQGLDVHDVELGALHAALNLADRVELTPRSVALGIAD